MKNHERTNHIKQPSLSPAPLLTEKRIAIIGAGPGGLTLARLL